MFLLLFVCVLCLFIYNACGVSFPQFGFLCWATLMSRRFKHVPITFQHTMKKLDVVTFSVLLLNSRCKVCIIAHMQVMRTFNNKGFCICTYFSLFWVRVRHILNANLVFCLHYVNNDHLQIRPSAKIIVWRVPLLLNSAACWLNRKLSSTNALHMLGSTLLLNVSC